MSREIEADFVEEHHNEEKQCHLCSSYYDGYCEELEQDVPETGHCDFFQSEN